VHVAYEDDGIVLRGEPAAVAAEAARIVRRFRDCNCPYRVVDEKPGRVVLGLKD
jgi:hypothetical protein